MKELIVAFRNYANAPKTSQLMLNAEIIAVCSKIHTKQANAACESSVKFLYVKPVGPQPNHWASEG